MYQSEIPGTITKLILDGLGCRGLPHQQSETEVLILSPGNRQYSVIINRRLLTDVHNYKFSNRSTYILQLSIGRRVVVALSQFPESGEVRPVVSRSRRVADVIAVTRTRQNADGQASSVTTNTSCT